jgi:RHS repeat-associated protein
MNTSSFSPRQRSSRIRSAVRLLLLVATTLLTASNLSAHYCGPPVIRCKPGDIVTYYIVADVSENEVSLYDVLGQTDPEVAPVVFFTPASKVFGLFVFEARQVGTNQATLFWSFPPNSAADICVVEIRVSTNEPPDTAGAHPFSVSFGDPVNMFTGEFTVQEPPDLMLGGPMRLFFARYYASRLKQDALVRSSLGNNWSHNFDWRAFILTNRAVIVAPDGFNVHFNRSGTNWVLSQPTNLTFQLRDNASGVLFGDARDNLLYQFSTNGLLTSISDGKGNIHTLTYTNDVQLRQVSDGLGRTLTFNYAGAQLLRSVTDGTRTIGFAHQQLFGAQFNLIRVTNALGRVTTYTYDSVNWDASLLTGTLYPEGNAGPSQTYDSAGRVLTQSRLNTNVTRFRYETNTFTTFATNALGSVIRYVHSPNGHLLSMTDPAGEVLTVGTNIMGLRGSVTGRDGASLGIAYDPVSLKPSAFTNAGGAVTAFTYTNRNVNGITLYELASVTLPDGTTERFTYDAVGNLIRHEDRAGNATRWTHNARGQWLTLTNPAGGLVSFTYNADGTLATRTDVETGTTSLFYDALRRPTNAVASDGRSVRVSFDAQDRVTSLTDERTNTTFFTYDSNDRLAAITNAAGHVVRFTYDAADRVVALIDPFGRSSLVSYDGLDQVTAFTNRNAHRTAFGWDARQRLTSVIDPGNQPWTYGYNDEELPLSSTDPLGNTLRRALNAAGFVTAYTNASNQAFLMNRDVMHRLISTMDPLGRVNQYAYDARGILTNTSFSAVGTARYESDPLGQLTRIIDHNGNPWRFEISNLGRLARQIDPLNRTNTIQLDGRGRPARLLYADGSSVTNSYDPAGNLSQMSVSGGLNFTFAYDALNRLTNASGLIFAYDAADRLTNTVSSGINFGAAYDSGGRLTNVSYNNGAFSVTYAYDSRDRLTQVSDSLSGAQMTFLYDNAGRLTNVVRANGVNGAYDYDAAGRVTRIREGSFLDLQYTLNAAAEVVALNATAPLSSAPAAGQTNQFTYDAAHQISSVGYTYDARGRLTASPGHTFVWDAASHLVRINNITNTYNGAGNILTRAAPDGTTRYHYNHAIGLAPIVAEQNAATAQFLRYYVWSPQGDLLYMINAADNSVRYFHFDRVGSTIALTSAAGSITDAYAYAPFGTLVARTGTNPQPFTFVGRHGVRTESAAGLYHMRARHYSPALGKFLSRDPVWPRPRDPLSLNPYQYAANNPLLHIDPTGLLEGAARQIQIRSTLLEVNRRFYEETGLHLPSIPGLTSPDQAVYLAAIMPLVFAMHHLQMLHTEDLHHELYRLRHQWELLARYNELTLTMRTHPFAFLRMLQVARSYDPAGISLAYPHLLGLPNATFCAMWEMNAFATLVRSLQPEIQAVAGYATALQHPHVNFMANYYLPVAFQQLLFGQMILSPRDFPRGVAFVNGQLATPKLSDLVYGAFERQKAYAELEFYDIWPEDIIDDLLTRLGVGGTSFGLDAH